MSKIFNLRLARKRKARDDKSKLADENRKMHGISTKTRKTAKAYSEISNARLDGKARDNKD